MAENQRIPSDNTASDVGGQTDNSHSGVSDFVQQIYTPPERSTTSTGSDTTTGSTNSIDRTKPAAIGDGANDGSPQFLNMDTGAVESGDASTPLNAADNARGLKGQPAETPEQTDTAQRVAQQRAEATAVAQVDGTKPTEANADAPKQSGEKNGSVEKSFGNSTIKFEDGKLSSIKLPTGLEIKRNADGKFESTTGGIKSVEFNNEKQQIEIQWEPKNGLNETSKITANGTESVYDKPSTKLGIKDVTSIEIAKGADGKNTMNIRKDNGEIVRLHGMEIDAKTGEFKSDKVEKIPAPADMTKEDLAKGAQEMARLIGKNGGSRFGDAGDQKYFKDMHEQYQKLGKSFDFEDDVNKALGPDSKVNFFEHSIRNGALSFSLNDKTTKRGVDSLHVREGWNPNKDLERRPTIPR